MAGVIPGEHEDAEPLAPDRCQGQSVSFLSSSADPWQGQQANPRHAEITSEPAGVAWPGGAAPSCDDMPCPSDIADDQVPLVLLDDDDAIAALPPAGVSPLLLGRLTTYAQGRLQAGEGNALLVALGADHPALIAAYRIGYLPRDWQEACGRVVRQAFCGYRLADTIVVPAFDAAGSIVDLLAIHPRASGGSYVGIHDPPRGLLAPAIATAHQDLIVTDSLRVVARRFAAGSTDTLLLRGPADAQANAGRLFAAGVRRVLVRTRTNAESIAAALRLAGIAVAVVSAHPQSDHVGYDVVSLPSTPSMVTDTVDHAAEGTDSGIVLLPPDESEEMPASDSATTSSVTAAAAVTVAASTPTLVSHDHQSERATFTVGAVTYVVEVPHDDTITRLEVVIRHAGQVHREMVDLSVPVACTRFAGNAALRCGIEVPLIVAHLPLLLAEVQELHRAETADTRAPESVVPAGPERDAALRLLRSPDLLNHLTSDLTVLGWVGEDDAKRVLLLTAISRKLPDPLWAIRTASSDFTGSHGLDLIAALTPPEDVIHVSRLSNAALTYQKADALRHKVLVIDEASALSSEVILALRVLRNRGALSQAIVPRHNLSGSARTRTIEVRGPIAVLSATATAGGLEHPFIAACARVSVDESRDQIERVLAAERRRYASPGGDGVALARAAIIHRHHTLQRLVTAAPVVVPFAERIQFPATTTRQCGEQTRFLTLVAASALLHQHQRLSDRGHVVADRRDFDVAVSLADAAGIGADAELGQSAAELVSVIARMPAASVTMDDMRRERPRWTRHAFRTVLAELAAAGLVTSPDAGRGREHRYAITPAARAAYGQGRPATPRITLGFAGGLAEVGETDPANFIPCG